MLEKEIIHRERKMLGLVGSAHFFSHFYLLSLPMMFLAIKANFGVSFTELGFITALYAITSGLGQYPVGVYADRYGPRWFIIGGLFTVCGSFILMGFSQSYWQLVALAIVAGFGDSVFHPCDLTIITNSVDQKRMGRSFAAHTFLGFLGFAAAPLIVGPMRMHWDWRVTAISIGIAGMVLVLILILNQGSLAVEKKIGEADKGSQPNDQMNAIQFLKSLPIFTLFMFYVAAALGSVGIQQFSPAALPMLYGVDETTAGRALSFFISGIAVGILVGGYVADKISKVELVSMVGYFVAANMVLIVAFVVMPFYLVVGALFVAGFSTGMVFPSRDMLVRSVTPKESSGKAFGFVNSGFSYGWFFGPILFGWIMDAGYVSGVYFTSSVFMILVVLAALMAGHFARRQIAVQTSPVKSTEISSGAAE